MILYLRRWKKHWMLKCWNVVTRKYLSWHCMLFIVDQKNNEIAFKKSMINLCCLWITWLFKIWKVLRGISRSEWSGVAQFKKRELFVSGKVDLGKRFCFLSANDSEGHKIIPQGSEVHDYMAMKSLAQFYIYLPAELYQYQIQQTVLINLKKIKEFLIKKQKKTKQKNIKKIVDDDEKLCF